MARNRLGQRNSRGTPTSRVERAKTWAHNQPIVAAIVILIGVTVTLGAFVAALNELNSAWKHFRSPPNPRLFEYAGQTVRLVGGNGLSFEQAIIITGAFNTDAGILAQYAWLGRFYRGYGLLCHAQVRRDGKHYDVFALQSPTEASRTLHFEVTEFFGTPDSEPEKSALPDSAILKRSLYTPNPRTIEERNANECAKVEGDVVILTPSPVRGGYLVTEEVRWWRRWLGNRR